MNKPKPQHIFLEQDYPQILHCPMCGQSVLRQDDSVGEQEDPVTPCPHLVVVWLGECSGYISSGFQTACEQVRPAVRKLAEKNDWCETLDEAEECDLDDYILYVLSEECDNGFLDFLALAGYDSNAVCFELVEHGMACGPVNLSSLFVFDCSCPE